MNTSTHTLLLASVLVVSFANSSFPCLGDETNAKPNPDDTRAGAVCPAAYQVFQREGYDPAKASSHEQGGPVMGHAVVAFRVALKHVQNGKVEVRVVVLPNGTGKGFEWKEITTAADGDERIGRVDVAAGGWYQLEVRCVADSKVVSTAAVGPFGVGEVFVIAGQSYAAGANDELLRVDDPAGRVVAYDVATRSWRKADDPQPNVGDGGTIWPALGNDLLPVLQVPIGFVNVASGGTSSRQWLPGEQLYKNLASAGKDTRQFRAVLWQQGESDVIEHVTTETYVANLQRIRNTLASEWGFEPVWLPAKSTLHPTVYNDPAGEGRIRAAIDQLWRTPGFRPGPDTDILDGDNRGPVGTRQHFSGIGQRRAGLLWFAAIWNELNRPQEKD